MSEQQQNVRGTIIRGDDGSLYFVPDSELEPYRVDDDNDKQVVQSDLEKTGAGADAARVSVSGVVGVYNDWVSGQDEDE